MKYLARIPTSDTLPTAAYLDHLQGLGTVCDIDASAALLLLEVEDEYQLAMTIYDLSKELGVPIDKPRPAPEINMLLPVALELPPSASKPFADQLDMVAKGLAEWNTRQHVHLSPMVDWPTIRLLGGFLSSLSQGLREGMFAEQTTVTNVTNVFNTAPAVQDRPDTEMDEASAQEVLERTRWGKGRGDRADADTTNTPRES